MPPRIMAAMPTRSTPHPKAFESLIKAAAPHQAPVCFPDNAPRDVNRNRIVRAFLDTDHEWLLSVDDDTSIPADTLDKLLAVGQPLAIGVQPLYLNGALVANVTPGVPTATESTDWPSWLLWDSAAPPFRVGACGFGCVLVHRAVLMDIGYPWFIENYGDERGRHPQTEDIYFCRRAAECGYEIWCQPSVVCGHFKTVDLRDFVPRGMVTVPDLPEMQAKVQNLFVPPQAVPA